MSGEMPTFPPADNPSDLGRGPLIMGLTWTMMGLATMMVTARFVIRMKPRLLGADDWVMLIALMLQLANQIIYTVGFSWGLGKHDKDLDFNPQMINIQKFNYIAVVPNLMASTVARISIAILLVRLFGSKKWFKWYMITHTAIVSLACVAYIPVLWTQSNPIEGLWNPLVEAKRRPTIRSGGFVYFIQAMLSLSDITFVLFPCIIIFKLNMPTSRKIGLAAMLCLSLGTFVISILKTIQVRVSVGRAGPNREDLQYETSLIQLWSGLEQCLVIILGCVPALRLLSKLEFTSRITSAASSLVRLFTSRDSKSRTGGSSATTATGSSKPSLVGYQDLEMQHRARGAYFPSGDDSQEQIVKSGGRTGTAVTADRNVHLAETGRHIHQTNQFAVSYETADQSERTMR